MSATTYSNAEAFLQTTQKFLEENEAANSLLLGICFWLKHNPDRVKTTPYLMTVEAGGSLVLAAVMTPPHNLVIYGQTTNRQAFAIFTQRLLVDNISPPGVLGPAQVAQGFASAWAEASRIEFKDGMRQRIYELRNVIPPQQATPGQMRLATEDEVDLVTAWALAFQSEALQPGDPGETREMIEHRIGQQEIFLWDCGQPVSMAAKARPISNGISVNLVYTPPEFRRRGYATAVVAALSQLLLDSGWQFCALFTDLSNPTSNHIYQAIGYTPVCDFNEYIFAPATNEKSP
ncbi:MAG: GNAT family N-acetyltransferase [Anaerolineae bacterium]|nr:GNAT family N-acetyltransferase [Anaerolineae bacterium]